MKIYVKDKKINYLDGTQLTINISDQILYSTQLSKQGVRNMVLSIQHEIMNTNLDIFKFQVYLQPLKTLLHVEKERVNEHQMVATAKRIEENIELAMIAVNPDTAVYISKGLIARRIDNTV